MATIVDPADIFGIEEDIELEVEPEVEEQDIVIAEESSDDGSEYVEPEELAENAAAVDPDSPHVQHSDITRTTVCVKLTRNKLGNSRKVSTSAIEVSADKDQIRVSKILLDSAEIKAIDRHDREVSAFLNRICLPFEVGIYLLPIKAIKKTDAFLKEAATKRKELVDVFVAAYPDLVHSAREKLRDLYDASQYPPVEEIDKHFSMYWQYITFGVPDVLNQISAEIWTEEQNKAQQRMQEAGHEIQNMLRVSMAKLTEHMAERLKSGEDGKPLKFQESTVKNLLEFLENFDFRNVTDDRDLQAEVLKARNLLKGVSADSLRTSDTMRAKVQLGMEAIATTLDGMVVRQGRKLRLDEDE